MTLKRRKSAFLGKILLELKKISPDQLNRALDLQKKKYPDKMVGKILVDLGYLTDDDVHKAVALQFNYPYIQIKKYNLEKELLHLISKKMAQKFKVIPLDKFGNILTVAMSNPLDGEALEEVGRVTGLEVRAFISQGEEIEETLALTYR